MWEIHNSNKLSIEGNFEASETLFSMAFGASQIASTKARSLKHGLPVAGGGGYYVATPAEPRGEKLLFFVQLLWG